MYKYCPKCKIDKPISDFSKNKTTKDGLQGYCKECSRLTKNKEKIRQYYEENIEYFREKNRRNWVERDPGEYSRKRKEYRAQNLDKRMLSSSKERAKKKGIEFNIELSDIIIPDYCPILEIPLFKDRKSVV